MSWQSARSVQRWSAAHASAALVLEELARRELSPTVVPSVALAWRFQCSGGYQLVECADGTQIGCSSGGQQFDCPENAASLSAFQNFCDDHGGIVGVVEEGLCTASDDDDAPVDTGSDEIEVRR